MNQPGAKPHSQTDHYLSLLDEYARYLAAEGKKVRRSPPEEGRRMFENSSEGRRAAIITRFETELEIFAEATRAGEKLTDSRRLLWRHFAKGGITPDSELFGNITDTDVVELYGLDQIHLCQTLNFFDWVTATLEQVFSDTWFQLSRRDPGIEAKLHELATKLFTGQVTKTYDPQIPWHVVEDLGSTPTNKFRLRLKCVSPVYRKGQFYGFVTVNECEKVT